MYIYEHYFTSLFDLFVKLKKEDFEVFEDNYLYEHYLYIFIIVRITRYIRFDYIIMINDEKLVKHMRLH